MENTDIKKTIDSVQSEISGIDNTAFSDTLTSLYEKIQQLADQLGFQMDELPFTKQEPQQQPNEVEKVELTPPTEQVFSINNIATV